MFDDLGNCRLVDFQMVSYGSIGTDLAIFIYMNIDYEVRKTSEKDFLKIYHDELEKTLRQNNFESSLFSLDDVNSALENKRICGLVLAVLNLPIQLMKKNFSDKFSGELREYYARTNSTELIFECIEVL